MTTKYRKSIKNIREITTTATEKLGGLSVYEKEEEYHMLLDRLSRGALQKENDQISLAVLLQQGFCPTIVPDPMA
jgi:hypothetical protein